MRSFTEHPSNPRAFLVLLCLCGAFLLTGCGAHRPPLSEIRGMQTRVVPGDERAVFEACVGTLQDMGYSIETSDSYGGVLTASRVTDDPSDAMPPPLPTQAKKGMPTWQKVALVATGVVLVGAVVAWVTHSDDDDKATQLAASDSTRARYRPDPRESRRTKKHHHDEPPEPPVVFVGSAPTPPTFYEYRISINLLGQEEDGTRVRVSLQGTEFQGSQTIRSGPLDDDEFYTRFFTALDRSLRLDLQAEAH